MTDPIGDISTRWEDQQNITEIHIARSWVRSYRQQFNTALNDEFTMAAQMERIVLVDGQSPEHLLLPDLIVTATDCADDVELAPHAIAIQDHLTALIGILLTRANQAQPSPVV